MPQDGQTMWLGTALPQVEHLENFGACQRLAARRVRFFIFEVRRFGTAMVLVVVKD
jgi:hypothetical protein